MTREEVREKFMQDVLGFLCNEEYLFLAECQDLQDTDTFEGLGFDSLDMVETLMRAERVFGIGISDEDVQKSQTIGQAVDYLYKRQTI